MAEGSTKGKTDPSTLDKMARLLTLTTRLAIRELKEGGKKASEFLDETIDKMEKELEKEDAPAEEKKEETKKEGATTA